jgi:two-component system chemotaxis sensor kinase CheA
VKPAIEDEEEELMAETKQKGEASFLVFEDRARERTALPLGVVERIESVPLSQIEYANGRPLLQYRGELLQLRDDGRVLDEMEAIEPQGEEAAATVLICGDARRKGTPRLGVVVRRVLDVSDGTMLKKDAANGGMDLALVKEKLTTIFRGLGSAESWKEVA